MKLKRLLENPYRIFSVLATKGAFRRVSDEPFLKLQFRAQMGKWPDLKAPKTFSEKLQWLKLYARKPEYTMMVDKYQVRQYISQTLGEEYLIPVLGVWDDPADIDFDALPERFVLKCNHNSGLGMCICKDKAKLDIPRVKADLARGLKQDYYLTGREWPYKDVPRKVICEAYMADENGQLPDYKVHCFDGKAKVVLVCRDRFEKTGLTEDFFTERWEHIPVQRPAHPNASGPIPKPVQLEKMLELAERLAREIPFVRIDFYEVEGRLYFGEMTFFPASGLEAFEPEEYDKTFGEWITLPG